MNKAKTMHETTIAISVGIAMDATSGYVVDPTKGVGDES